MIDRPPHVLLCQQALPPAFRHSGGTALHARPPYVRTTPNSCPATSRMWPPPPAPLALLFLVYSPDLGAPGTSLSPSVRPLSVPPSRAPPSPRSQHSSCPVPTLPSANRALQAPPPHAACHIQTRHKRNFLVLSSFRISRMRLHSESQSNIRDSSRSLSTYVTLSVTQNFLHIHAPPSQSPVVPLGSESAQWQCLCRMIS